MPKSKKVKSQSKKIVPLNKTLSKLLKPKKIKQPKGLNFTPEVGLRNTSIDYEKQFINGELDFIRKNNRYSRLAFNKNLNRFNELFPQANLKLNDDVIDRLYDDIIERSAKILGTRTIVKKANEKHFYDVFDKFNEKVSNAITFIVNPIIDEGSESYELISKKHFENISKQLKDILKYARENDDEFESEIESGEYRTYRKMIDEIDSALKQYTEMYDLDTLFDKEIKRFDEILNHFESIDISTRKGKVQFIKDAKKYWVEVDRIIQSLKRHNIDAENTDLLPKYIEPLTEIKNRFIHLAQINGDILDELNKNNNARLALMNKGNRKIELRNILKKIIQANKDEQKRLMDEEEEYNAPDNLQDSFMNEDVFLKQLQANDKQVLNKIIDGMDTRKPMWKEFQRSAASVFKEENIKFSTNPTENEKRRKKLVSEYYGKYKKDLEEMEKAQQKLLELIPEITQNENIYHYIHTGQNEEAKKVIWFILMRNNLNLSNEALNQYIDKIIKHIRGLDDARNIDIEKASLANEISNDTDFIQLMSDRSVDPNELRKYVKKMIKKNKLSGYFNDDEDIDDLTEQIQERILERNRLTYTPPDQQPKSKFQLADYSQLNQDVDDQLKRIDDNYKQTQQPSPVQQQINLTNDDIKQLSQRVAFALEDDIDSIIKSDGTVDKSLIIEQLNYSLNSDGIDHNNVDKSDYNAIIRGVLHYLKVHKQGLQKLTASGKYKKSNNLVSEAKIRKITQKLLKKYI